MLDISNLNPRQLLALHGKIADELIARRITRSYNNPTGDFAEFLFCRAFEWQLVPKSNKHVDAIASNGVRYQIKGRRITRRNKSRQLGTLRDLNGEHFDFLAGVLFKEDYGVLRAAIIPKPVVLAHAVFVNWTNSHRFLLRDEIWSVPGVQDVTTQMAAVDF